MLHSVESVFLCAPFFLLTADFYRAFEDKHRGARELIKSRLRVYLPFLLPLATKYPDCSVLDLGCGRGEWLELLQENRIVASGVDLDDNMLADCRELGLDVANEDAIEHLKSLPDQSRLAITGFHIAEHLPFSLLQMLFVEARRVLKPNGLLILETPNPENLVVGAASFYIDPTHQRPLPSQLLQFLAEHQGFARVKILRLQEEHRLLEGIQIGLYDVLAGVSPDYAIVAQPNFDIRQPDQLANVFSVEHGVSLYDLASRYDQELKAVFNSQLQAIHAARGRAEEAQDVALHAAQRSEQLAAELGAVYASHSWRLTRPLRWLARRIRSLRKDA